MNWFILFFVACFVKAFSVSDLPEPYCWVEPMPFDAQGMFSKECESNLEYYIKKHNVKCVIEVGSWLGSSTRAIATFLPDDGVVYAVDHWKGSAEHQVRHKKKIPTLYEQFLSNIIHADLTHKIIPIRMNSVDAAKQLDIVPDLIYLDASHDEESVYQDLVAWWPFVKGHGILCGDDYQYPGGGVGKAVRRFAQEHNLHVKGLRWFWIYTEE